ncbi:MAG: dienelactone hydrolase family protein, partial [Planctomycetaceae bacterium]|nr:dienelactone hydrolase family protein [Planctomycetaceae bacterium]
QNPEIFPTDTVPLTIEGDMASRMVDGIDRFLLQQIDSNATSRVTRFIVDPSTIAAYETSLKPHRKRLAKCLGVRDVRLPFINPEVISAVGAELVIAQSEKFTVQAIRWPVLSDPSPQGQGLTSISGEGLLLTPKGKIVANVVVLPDADQTPEQISGISEGVTESSQTARFLAESGCRVVVPALISRHREKRLGRADLTNREYLHRAAFELGRTLAGYEVQMTLSVVDWFSATSPETPVGIYGYGEGGMLALFAAGLDSRINAACVSGFFGPREASWKEPIDRNFAGLLRDFGHQELAMLVAPRRLVVQHNNVPSVRLEGNGGAPAEILQPDADALRNDFRRIKERTAPLKDWFDLQIQSTTPDIASLSAFFRGLVGDRSQLSEELSALSPSIQVPADRESRLVKQIDRHNQLLLRESPFVRQKFMSKIDTNSVETYEKSSEAYREIFRKDVIGKFEVPMLPFNAKSRKSWDHEKWTGHEVMLDVFPDVFAYGVLLIPKDMKPGERRPVVVCQHGLEGRPTDVFLGDSPSYHDFAAKLCEQGFITFAPQNPYIFTDRFRTLQRKAQPLGKSLFSIIVPQHQQIVDWLQSQPFVDPDRIAFYGLSYGGKSAMRIPALVTDYCLSICSADFNEWVLKNASTRHNFSYIWTGEYEIFEWDLGSTFNYAEMAALICPRPFMVERGHFDGVGEDDWVAYEYAKIRYLYAAKLSIGDRTEIEWFVGPHTINGKGTFRFLHQHLHFEPSKQ